MKKKKPSVGVLLLALVLIICSAFAVSEEAEQADRRITFDSDSYIVFVGKQLKIAATVENLSEAAGKTVLVWNSSNPDIATVNNGGAVIGKAAGTVIITASAKDNEKISHEVTVEVRVPVKTVTINETKVTLLVGAGEEASTGKLTYTIDPQDAYYKTGKWESSNEEIVKVDEDGTIHGLKAGNASVTFISDEPDSKKTARVQIAVNQAVTGITLSETSVTIDKGKTASVKTTIEPKTAASKNLKWISSDENIATVSKTGTIKAINKGTCTITCVAEDGSGVKAECVVDVISMVKNLKANGDIKTVMFAGEDKKVSVSVEPLDATNKKLQWTSSDNSVASVNSEGVITGKRKGKCKVTAATTDGSNKKMVYDVVIEPENPITLESLGFGVFQVNLLGLTVRNNCQTKSIVNFDFDVSLHSGWATETGSYTLGKDSKVGPGRKKTIKRNLFGVGYSSSISITITGVWFSDGSYYKIPESVQEGWTFSR